MGIFTDIAVGLPDIAGCDDRSSSDQKRSAQNAYHQAKARDERDIAKRYEWESKDPARRESCRPDLRLFLLTYFPHVFRFPFSETHIRLITMAEEAILHGGLHCQSFFRGGGKTSIFARAVLWAIAYAHRKYAVIVGATDELAALLMDVHVRRELSENELLIADFPELCNPFIALEGHGRKSKGQLFNGTRTLIVWRDDKLVCAEIPPAINSGVAGSVILVKSITGAMKGQTHKLRYNSQVIRPDILLLDDIQTRESAGSPISTKKRIDTVQGDALGLAGHDRVIAAVQAVTPIYGNDLACQFLDRTKKPEWRGITTSMVVRMPDREDLWDQYRVILHDALKNDGDPENATRFYLANQADMHWGSILAWPERIPEGYVSALQYAMDLKIRDPEAFAAEYQCKPVTIAIGPGLMLTRDEIARKVNGLPAGVVPDGSQWLTCFVDVGDSYLFYAVCAFEKDFSGACIEYGAWPEQKRRYFSKREANPTIADFLAQKNPSLIGSPTKTLLAAALDLCIPELLARTWKTSDGRAFAINRLLIDTGYEAGLVRGAIQRLRQRADQLPPVMPSRGIGIGAKAKPMSADSKKPGDIYGRHWRARKPDLGKLRHVDIDTNSWKSSLHQQLFSPLGKPGCFSLYGDAHADHALMADHLTSEDPKIVSNETKGEQRTVVEWLLKPGREQEGLDCLVGCFVAAATLGAELSGASEPDKPRSGGPVLTLSELRAKKRGG